MSFDTKTLVQLSLEEIYHPQHGMVPMHLGCDNRVCIIGKTGMAKTKGAMAWARQVDDQQLAAMRPKTWGVQKLQRMVVIYNNMAVTGEHERAGLMGFDFSGQAGKDNTELKPSQPAYATKRAFEQQRTQPKLFQVLDSMCDESYDDAAILIIDDEINGGGVIQFQSMELQSSMTLGDWRIPKKLQDRVCFMSLGNRPEDNPYVFEWVGPFGGRVWMCEQVLKMPEAIAYLDTTDMGCHPVLGDVFEARPHWLHITEVTQDGHKILAGEYADQPAISLANPFSARRLEELNRLMHRVDAVGLDMIQAKKLYRTGCPEEIAVALTTERALMEHITKIEAVLADPENAPIPSGILDQTMQVRYLLPRMDELNAGTVLKYMDRMEDKVLSIVRGKVIAISDELDAREREAAAGMDVDVDVSTVRGWSMKLVNKVRSRYSKQWSLNHTQSMGKQAITIGDDEIEMDELPDYSKYTSVDDTDIDDTDAIVLDMGGSLDVEEIDEEDIQTEDDGTPSQDLESLLDDDNFDDFDFD